MRESYSLAGLAEGDLAPDWVTQFRSWLADAVAAGIAEPNAMVVATASPSGEVASRSVLCKGAGRGGRGVLHQPDLGQEPRPAGESAGRRDLPVDRVCSGRCTSAGRSSGCPTRPPRSTGRPARGGRGSGRGRARSPPCCRIGPRWRRCRPAPASGSATRTRPTPIPLPPFWGGWRIQPETVEFWQGRYARLHDRLRYRANGSGGWVIERLAP